MSSPHKALAAFAEDSDLVRLESLLKRFNLFEALGVVRHELRHSDLLAFLLDPSGNHGLGAAFLEALLQATSDLQFTDLGRATVLREWHNIDILVLDEVNHVAVLIENKIDTGEHSGQLDRYYDDVRRNYPSHKIVALYLTRGGDAPSNDSYTPVSYSLICKLIEQLLVDHRSTLGNDVAMLLEHYVQMLRRHIVSESDVADLCRSLYQKHKQALDLIFEHRPAQPSQIGQYLESLVLQDERFRLYSVSKKWTWINFTLQEWDAALRFRDPTSGYAMCPYLGFESVTRHLAISLWTGPGSPAARQKILQMAENHSLAGVSRSLSGTEWSRISTIRILQTADYAKTQEEIQSLILEKWEAYLRDELPRIEQAVREEEWLWTL